MDLPKGTVWPWMSLVPPPEGWDFFPNNMRYMRMEALPIVATRDHTSPPVLPAEWVERMSTYLATHPHRVSAQGRLAGKVEP